MTTPEKLQKIDQTLIQLLGERILALAEMETASIEEQLSSHKALLMATGVSESMWSNIVTSSMAALANAASSTRTANGHKITVVGGRGAMGRFFVDRLAAAGHQVSVLEYDGWIDADLVLCNADLVLICVPLKAVSAVIRRVAPFLSPTALLADIASIKVPIMETMLECHPGPVMGLHPMFGPGVESFMAQKIVTCPGRNPEAFQWLLNCMQADGGKLINCSAEEHDRMMITVQAIRHFVTFSLGVFLAEEGIDVNRTLEFSTPLYRTEMNMVSRLFAQDGSLYIDILLASEDRSEAVQRLVQTCERLSQLLKTGDRTALITEFEAAQSAFQQESSRALKESNHIINSLSTFLTASEMASTQAASLLMSKLVP